MNVYSYHGVLLCEDCVPTIENDEDVGWFPNGGGEADTPQHCHCCGVFLENPLTRDGEDYVRSALDDGDGNPEVLEIWREFYYYLNY